MKLVMIVVAFTILSPVLVGCSKKETGICYCSYVSGDKKEFDLRGIARTQAQDSCNKIDRNANAFGGECELK